MKDHLTIRRNSESKSLVYLVVLIMGLLFVTFLMIKYPDLKGAYISVGIGLFILSLLLIANWLPKIWIQVQGDSILISEGITKKVK